MLTELPRDVPDMDMFDLTTLNKVAEMAAGMSKEEIYETFSVDPEDFTKDEKIYFTEFYNYGRGMAINRVVQNLVEATKGRTGTIASMAFLRRFAKEWEGEVEGDASGSMSFQFGIPAPAQKS